MARLKRVIFFAQDEGSAKALVPIIRNMTARKELDLAVVAGTFAARTFRQSNVAYSDAGNYPARAAFSPEPDLVITGASMRTSIEKEAIGLARKSGVKSVTLLDSPAWLWWRFTVDGAQDMTALPDYIMVPDPVCKDQMISEQFPAERLVATGNPHFDFLLTRVASISHTLRNVLVVTQPQYRDCIYQSDLPWLEAVVTLCQQLDPDISMTIRPHSKEDPRRFQFLLSRRCHVDAQSDILDLIESHQVIIGKNSSALFEAALLGKKVISFSRRKSELLTSSIAGWGLFEQATKGDDLKELLKGGMSQRISYPVPQDIPYYTDGCNSKRAIDFIKMLLKI